MGIPGFNTWFQIQHAGAYQPLTEAAPFDHVYIDMASILHTTLRRAETKPGFHRALHRELDSILAMTKPQQSVTMALDGPAPVAKLLTQRRRRVTQMRKEARDAGSRKGRNSRYPKSAMSRTALTPGSPFMLEVQSSLEFYACRALQSTKWAGVNFEISGSCVPGEGEVKIFHRIMQPWPAVDDRGIDGGSHVVVGSDADIVLMALVCCTPRVYVMPDSKPLRGQRMVLSVDTQHLLELSTAPLAAVAAEFPGGNSSFLQGLSEDLTIVSMLGSGNDYLPGVNGMAQLIPVRGANAGLWAVYLKLRRSPAWANRSLVRSGSDGSAQLDAEFIEALIKGGRTYRPRPPGTVQQPPQVTTAPDVSTELSTDSESAPESSSSSSEEDSLVVATGGANDLLPADPQRYLQGILWVLEMYRSGLCGDFRYTYECYAPSSDGILQALEAQTANPSSAPFARTESAEAGPLVPAACALALMPRSAADLAPTALRHLMQAGPPIGDLFDTCAECETLMGTQYRISTIQLRVKMEWSEAMQKLRPSGGKPKWIPKHQRVKNSNSKARNAPVCSECGRPESKDATVPKFEEGGLEVPTCGKCEERAKNAQAFPSASEEGGSESASSQTLSARENLSKLDERLEMLRQDAGDISRERERHQREMHPYQSFPLDRLVAAVSAVPLSAYPLTEQPLASFDAPLRFRRSIGGGRPDFPVPRPPPGSHSTWQLRQPLGIVRDVWPTATLTSNGDMPQLEVPINGSSANGRADNGVDNVGVVMNGDEEGGAVVSNKVEEGQVCVEAASAGHVAGFTIPAVRAPAQPRSNCGGLVQSRGGFNARFQGWFGPQSSRDRSSRRSLNPIYQQGVTRAASRRPSVPAPQRRRELAGHGFRRVLTGSRGATQGRSMQSLYI